LEPFCEPRTWVSSLFHYSFVNAIISLVPYLFTLQSVHLFAIHGHKWLFFSSLKRKAFAQWQCTAQRFQIVNEVVHILAQFWHSRDLQHREVVSPISTVSRYTRQLHLLSTEMSRGRTWQCTTLQVSESRSYLFVVVFFVQHVVGCLFSHCRGPLYCRRQLPVFVSMLFVVILFYKTQNRILYY